MYTSVLLIYHTALLYITLIGFGECVSAQNNISIKTQTTILNLEKYISSRREIPISCGIVIFMTGSLLDFTPSTERTTLIYGETNSKYNLNLTTPCNILAIIGFQNEERFIKYDNFVTRNFERIRLVLIFPLNPNFKRTFLKLIPWKSMWYLDILMINSDGTSIHELGKKSCGYENPRCFLKGISLKIGFTAVSKNCPLTIPPYLRVRDWYEYKEKKIQYPKIVLNHSMSQSQLEILDGIEGQFIRYFVTEYNMKMTLIAPSDMIHGLKVANGSWTGKFGLLYRKEVDLVVGLITGNFERTGIGKYLAPLYNVHFTLISRKRTPSPSWFGQFSVLPLIIWVILFGNLVVLGIIMNWITKIHSQMRSITQLIQERSSLLGMLSLLLKSLIQQTLHRIPTGPAVLAFAYWFLFVLTIKSIYSSNLTARLSVPEVIQRVNTMQDVWEMKKTVVVLEGGTVDLYTKHTSEPFTKLVTKHLKRYSNTFIKYNAATLENDQYVGSNEKEHFKYKISAGIEVKGRTVSDYHFSKEPLVNVFCSWLATKELIVRPALITAILRAETMGLLAKWSIGHFNGNATMDHDTESHNAETLQLTIAGGEAALTIGNIKGSLLVWAVGMALSLLTFIIEMSIYKNFNRMHIFEFEYLD